MKNTKKTQGNVHGRIWISVTLVLAAIIVFYIFVFDPLVNPEDYNQNIGWIDSYTEISELLQNDDHNFVLPDEALIMKYAQDASYKRQRKNVLFKVTMGYWLQAEGDCGCCPYVRCELTEDYYFDRGRVLAYQEEYNGVELKVYEPNDVHYMVLFSVYDCTYEIQGHDEAVALEFAKNIVDNAIG